MLWWEMYWTIRKGYSSAWTCTAPAPDTTGPWVMKDYKDVRTWLWDRISRWQREGDYFNVILSPDGTRLRVNHIAAPFQGWFNATYIAENLSAMQVHETIEPYLYMICTKDPP